MDAEKWWKIGRNTKTVYRNKKHRQINKFKPFKRQAGMSRLFSCMQKITRVMPMAWTTYEQQN